MSTAKLNVETKNILPIIKKWLYSEKEIFIRELISNSLDAIQKVKKISLIEDIRNPEDLDFSIKIHLDEEKHTLSIEDNGIGMDKDEIVRYLSNIAFSGAYEFIEKYEKNIEEDIQNSTSNKSQNDLRDQKDKAGIIGNFGLGFYSSFIVAEKVVVESLSYKKDASAVLWTCDGSEDYELKEGTRDKRGTTITLFLPKEENKFLDENEISTLIRRYADFVNTPIHLSKGTDEGKQINHCEPLWAKAPKDIKDKEKYAEFYKYLYPFQENPLFHIHLNIDYPFPLKGILFFPKLSHEIEWNKSNVKIYCKQVFVSEQSQDVIPQFLAILQGVIDIPNLPLNVSRSYLQSDSNVRKISNYIIKKIAETLKSKYTKEREEYDRIWPDLAAFVKYAMLNDQKFYEQALPALVFEFARPTHVAATDSSDANAAMKTITLMDYLAKNKEKTKDQIFYTNNPKEHAAALDMLYQEGIDVLLLDSVIDTHFIQFLESKKDDENHYKFIRIDAEITEYMSESPPVSIVDKDGEDSGEKENTNLIDFFKNSLKVLPASEQITIEVKNFKDEKTPALLVYPEQTRRFQDMAAMYQQSNQQPNQEGDNQAPVPHTLVLNKKNAIINSLIPSALVDSSSTQSSRKDDIARQIYYLTRLSQNKLSASESKDLMQTSYNLLTENV